ncbi:hypothetical protein [Ferrovibrio sp.]|uniref:hypothetical protein n=1 Tax=Ferrovibrio sp. TaxID=1917215 RepID=UPI0035AFA50F
MNRATVLASHALTADLGRAMLACTSAKRCRLPYCGRCRMDRNDRIRAEASDQFRNPAACVAATANVAAIPLDDTQALQEALRLERGRLRTALNKFGPIRLLGAFELVLKHRSEVDAKCYPVQGVADWYVLLHWHALVEADADEFKQFLQNTYKVGQYSGHRIDVRELRSGDQVDVENWAAYCFKVSTTLVRPDGKQAKSGLESDMAKPHMDDLLPKLVHAYESIRGRGLNGVRLSYGLSDSSKIITGDDPKRMDQSVLTVLSVVSVVDTQVHQSPITLLRNYDPKAIPSRDSSSSTYAEPRGGKIRLSVSRAAMAATLARQWEGANQGRRRPPDEVQ